MRTAVSIAGTIERADLELLKLVGAALMVYEHVWRYVVGSFPAHVQLLGRIVFPAFVLALALGMRFARQETVLGTCRRMALWGVVAGIGSMVVRDTPSNVLFTFALGTLLHAALFGFLRVRWIAIALCILLSFGCEGGPWWVMAVAAALTCARTNRAALRAVSGALAVLGICVGQYYVQAAAFGVAAALLLLLVPTAVPRVRRAFYWVYAGQWPLIAALRWVL